MKDVRQNTQSTFYADRTTSLQTRNQTSGAFIASMDNRRMEENERGNRDGNMLQLASAYGRDNAVEIIDLYPVVYNRVFTHDFPSTSLFEAP